MWHRVDVVLTDVSEERIASSFRVEGEIRKSESEKTVRTGASRLMLQSPSP
jgi:predicted transcriptional regulator